MIWWMWACTGPDPVKLPGATGDTGTPSAGEPVPVEDTTPVVLSVTPCDACGGSCTIEELSYERSYHTTAPIEYASTPPAGGPHDPCWTTFGVHDGAVDDERWVHNLEHGGVALLYACEDCEAEVAELEQVALGSPFGLALPYDGMEATFAAVAWGWRWTASCWDADLARDFVLAHQDEAPESVLADPSAGCM